MCTTLGKEKDVLAAIKYNKNLDVKHFLFQVYTFALNYMIILRQRNF